jgi:hypothetical protein
VSVGAALICAGTCRGPAARSIQLALILMVEPSGQVAAHLQEVLCLPGGLQPLGASYFADGRHASGGGPRATALWHRH